MKDTSSSRFIMSKNIMDFNYGRELIILFAHVVAFVGLTIWTIMYLRNEIYTLISYVPIGLSLVLNIWRVSRY